VTGYLAFNLWYSLLFCRPLPLLAIWEHAVTLTVFLVVLAREAAASSTDNVGDAKENRAYITAWLAYKTVGFILSMKDHPNGIQVSASTTEQQHTTKHPKTALSDKVMHSSSFPEKQNKPIATTATTTNETTAITKNMDNLWTIHGEEYDLSDFVKIHPGGVEAIELGRSRDCTALFESYHTFTNQHRVILKKYHKNKANNNNNNTTDATTATTADPFYEVLKDRVIETLKENNIDPKTGRTATFGRAVYYMTLIVCLVLSASFHMKASLLGSFSFACFGWLIGCLGHDGGHFAVSRTPWINDLSVWGISLLCNPAMWQVQHTYAHHSHTNDFDHDPDLHHFDIFLRVHRRIQHEKMHDYQRNRFYVFFAYSFVVFGTCLKIPVGMMTTGTLYGMAEWTDRKRPARALILWVHFALYLAIIVFSPFFSGKSFLVALLSVIVHIATAGLLFAIFSQINHLNELSLELPMDNESKCNNNNDDVDDFAVMKNEKRELAKNSWAARQVETSNNFATDSMCWHLLSNGLNMQIEHHLFPSLNHAHLHVISPVVQQTCKEYGVRYKSYESWSEIIDAALQWLDKVAAEEK